jgi:hypothetical protein
LLHWFYHVFSFRLLAKHNGTQGGLVWSLTSVYMCIYTRIYHLTEWISGGDNHQKNFVLKVVVALWPLGHPLGNYSCFLQQLCKNTSRSFISNSFSSLIQTFCNITLGCVSKSVEQTESLTNTKRYSNFDLIMFYRLLRALD